MFDTSNFPHPEDVESYIAGFAKAGIAISSIEIRPFALRINVKDPIPEQALNPGDGPRLPPPHTAEKPTNGNDR